MTPPSTPTPRRFLLSKRPPPQPQQQTPAPPHTGPLQFQSTPRFAPSSTPRPSTQGFPGTLRRKYQDPINDVPESSPSSPPPATFKHVSDSIEVESEVASDSQLQWSDHAPSPKRRRISISPEQDWEIDVAVQEDTALVIEGDVEKDYANSSGLDDEVIPDADYAESEDDLTGIAEGLERAAAVPHKPEFQKAPRFKVTDADSTRQEGLPEAFSPQRRGVKYIAGGLAAELQTWLAEVKGWEGNDRPSESVMKMVIDEVKSGSNMYLVKGRRITSENDAEEASLSVVSARLMLAGEGKLTGLGRKANITVGSVVVIAQPAWEVSLEECGSWIVACDWAVS